MRWLEMTGNLIEIASQKSALISQKHGEENLNILITAMQRCMQKMIHRSAISVSSVKAAIKFVRNNQITLQYYTTIPSN